MKILVKPIVTEKLNELAEKLHRYGFVVNKNANKVQIKKAVEGYYNFTVESVNTANFGSKKKSRFTKGGVISGKTPAYKKAFVTLKQGEIIDFYSNI